MLLCRAFHSGNRVLRKDVAKGTVMQKTLKLSYVLFFLFGAALMLGVRTLRGSNAQQFEHVYELRIYHVHEGKADALRDRFGNYTDALFKRHNMKSIGYWVPENAPDSQKLFIYILEHPSRQEAEKDWVAFKADAEWQKVKAQSEANGPLVDQEDSYFMDPTTYSALK
jgi:NIPSNAP protein